MKFIISEIAFNSSPINVYTRGNASWTFIFKPTESSQLSDAQIEIKLLANDDRVDDFMKAFENKTEFSLDFVKEELPSTAAVHSGGR